MADNKPNFEDIKKEAKASAEEFASLSTTFEKLISKSKDLTDQFQSQNTASKQLAEILQNTGEVQLKNKKKLKEFESATAAAQKDIKKLTSEINKFESKNKDLKGAQKKLANEILSAKVDELENSKLLLEDANALLEYEKNRSDIIGDIDKQLQKIQGINNMLSLSFFGLQMLKISEQTANFQKSLLLSAEQAKTLRQEFVDTAKASGDTFITTNKLIEANTALGKQLGFNKNFGTDLNTEFVNLTKRVGLSEEAASGFAKASIISGKTLKTTAETASGIVSSVSSQYGIQLDIKDVLNEAGTSSAIMLSNFKGSTDALVQGVSQMKALGTSLAQTDQQAASLLDFQTSIENQLKASLFTGRQINLEKARELALNNDLNGVAKELANQQMSFGEFQKLLRPQQEAFAQSLGLTRDTLADQLLKQAVQKKSQSEIVALYGKEAYERSQTLNIQEKFNAAIEKMSDLVGNLAAGPLGTVADMLGKAAESSGIMYTALAALAGIQLFKLIQQVRSLLAAETLAAFIANPLGAAIGGGLAVAALYGIGSAIDSFSKSDDLMSGYGNRTLVTPQGTYALNNNDTVIAGTNLFKGNDVYSGPKDSINLGGSIDYDKLASAMSKVQVVSQVKVSEFANPITIYQQQNMRRSI
jgi:hypothetical protein